MAIVYNPLTQRYEEDNDWWNPLTWGQSTAPAPSPTGGIDPWGNDSAPRTVPIGTKDTFNGYVYVWDGKQYVNTGIPDPSASSGGRTFEQDMILKGMPSYSISSSTSSQDPAQFAARMEFEAAQAGLDRQFRAGESTADRALRLQMQLEQQGFTRGENLADRQFRSGESGLDRTFRAGESAADRAFRSGESAADRAMRAAEFAATYGLNRAQFEATQNQAESAFNRQKSRDALDAAKQYADLINTVDPNAFNAFLSTGGGNIGNAIALGASALSDRAALPSARSQMSLDGINASYFQRTALPPMPSFAQPAPAPTNIDPKLAADQARGAALAAAYNAAYNITNPTIYAPQGYDASGSTIANTSMPTSPTAADANASLAAAWSSYGSAPPAGLGGFARGGMTNAPMFMTGDSPSGAPTGNEEVIVNPTNAPIKVIPNPRNAMPGMASGQGVANRSDRASEVLAMLAAGQRPQVSPMFAGGQPPQATPMPYAGQRPQMNPMLGQMGYHRMPDGSMMAGAMPRFAMGTIMPDEAVTAADRPYIDNVLNFRRNATVPDFNPFDVGFRNVNPFSRASFFAGRQTRYGIPMAAQEFEAQRYAVPGQSRSTMSAQGY
jgi:hypothetical protein